MISMLPAVPLAVARVHAVQVGGEQRRLVAAGAGADLDDGVAVVERIARHEQRRERAPRARRCRARGALDLGARFGGHLGVVNGNELARLRELVFGLFELARAISTTGVSRRCSRPSSANCPGSLERAPGWRARARPPRRGRARPPTDREGQSRDRRPSASRACFANFWRKRSTRPAVSTQPLLAREERVAGGADVGVDLGAASSASGTYCRRRT